MTEQVDPLVTTGTSKVSKGALLPKPKPENRPAEPSEEKTATESEPTTSDGPTIVLPESDLDAVQTAVKTLKLGKDASSRLYSALVASNIRSYEDARKRPMAVVAALNTAQNVNAMHIIDALREATSDSS